MTQPSNTTDPTLWEKGLAQVIGGKDFDRTTITSPDWLHYDSWWNENWGSLGKNGKPWNWDYSVGQPGQNMFVIYRKEKANAAKGTFFEHGKYYVLRVMVNYFDGATSAANESSPASSDAAQGKYKAFVDQTNQALGGIGDYLNSSTFETAAQTFYNSYVWLGDAATKMTTQYNKLHATDSGFKGSAAQAFGEVINSLKMEMLQLQDSIKTSKDWVELMHQNSSDIETFGKSLGNAWADFNNHPAHDPGVMLQSIAAQVAQICDAPQSNHDAGSSWPFALKFGDNFSSTYDFYNGAEVVRLGTDVKSQFGLALQSLDAAFQKAFGGLKQSFQNTLTGMAEPMDFVPPPSQIKPDPGDGPGGDDSGGDGNNKVSIDWGDGPKGIGGGGDGGGGGGDGSGSQGIDDILNKLGVNGGGGGGAGGGGSAGSSGGDGGGPGAGGNFGNLFSNNGGGGSTGAGNTGAGGDFGNLTGGGSSGGDGGPGAGVAGLTGLGSLGGSTGKNGSSTSKTGSTGGLGADGLEDFTGGDSGGDATGANLGNIGGTNGASGLNGKNLFGQTGTGGGLGGSTAGSSGGDGGPGSGFSGGLGGGKSGSSFGGDGGLGGPNSGSSFGGLGGGDGSTGGFGSLGSDGGGAGGTAGPLGSLSGSGGDGGGLSSGANMGAVGDGNAFSNMGGDSVPDNGYSLGSGLTPPGGVPGTSGAVGGLGGGAGGAAGGMGGGMPPMGGMGGGGGGGQEKERERNTWLDEDEEVWGTDQDFGPAVVGRDDYGTEQDERPQRPGAPRTPGSPQTPVRAPGRATGRG